MSGEGWAAIGVLLLGVGIGATQAIGPESLGLPARAAAWLGVVAGFVAGRRRRW